MTYVYGIRFLRSNLRSCYGWKHPGIGLITAHEFRQTNNETGMHFILATDERFIKPKRPFPITTEPEPRWPEDDDRWERSMWGYDTGKFVVVRALEQDIVKGKIGFRAPAIEALTEPFDLWSKAVASCNELSALESEIK